jgi:hypothetical protein
MLKELELVQVIDPLEGSGPPTEFVMFQLKTPVTEPLPENEIQK